MGTQMSYARKGQATDEMIRISKDERTSIEALMHGIAKGSIIIPRNLARKQEAVRIVGIGDGLKTKVNVNIGTSTLYQDLDEEVSKAKIAVNHGADTIMDLSDGGDLDLNQRKTIRRSQNNFWFSSDLSSLCAWCSEIQEPS